MKYQVDNEVVKYQVESEVVFIGKIEIEKKIEKEKYQMDNEVVKYQGESKVGNDIYWGVMYWWEYMRKNSCAESHCFYGDYIEVSCIVGNIWGKPVVLSHTVFMGIKLCDVYYGHILRCCVLMGIYEENQLCWVTLFSWGSSCV